ncbi:LysM peptidoglycan-binding domain-containing protein [Pycnococcus provasolii]
MHSLIKDVRLRLRGSLCSFVLVLVMIVRLVLDHEAFVPLSYPTRGDWLSNIAPKYNVSVEDIKQANASVLGEESVIYPGQKLVIPGGDAGAGTLKTVVALGAAAAAAVFVLLRKK